MMGTGKFWILALCLPGVALLPDVTYILLKKVFYPTPTDLILIEQKKNPNFRFQIGTLQG
jgi:hypothetical protein